MPQLKLKRTTTTTTIEEFQVSELELSRNHGLIMQILAGLTKYDENQVQSRALQKTAAQPLSILDEDASLDDQALVSDQEEEAKEADVRSDNYEYRKRKNRFIDGESPEDNRGRSRKKQNRKIRVIESDIDEETDELTFEELL